MESKAVSFLNPHTILDGFESLRRHHLAKQAIRENQLTLIPISKGARILDIGCGPGLYLTFWLERTRSQGASFTLLDSSDPALQECLEQARKVGSESRVQIINKDLYQLTPDQLGIYDVIFIGNTLEYIREPENYLRNIIFPLLKPSGVLAIRDLDCGIMNCNGVDPSLSSKIVLSRIQGCQMISRDPARFHNPFIGRDLPIIYKTSGLIDIQLFPFYCEFRPPLSLAAKVYLSRLHTSWYTEDLPGILSLQEKQLWHQYFDLENPNSLLHRDDFYYVESEFLILGRKA